MSKRYGIKYFYDITDRSNFRANPDYKGVCHIAMAQEGHCLPGAPALTDYSILRQHQGLHVVPTRRPVPLMRLIRLPHSWRHITHPAQAWQLPLM